MPAYLFDIDGTLIDSRGAGRASLTAALAEVFDLEDQHEELVTSGRTDRSIARDFFAAHDLEDNEENWQRLTAGYHEHLTRQLPLRQGYVLPGVHDFLNHLAGQDDSHVGLLTGNTEEGARRKLEFFGIWDHFAFGAYGETHLDRNDIAADALAKLHAAAGSDFPPDQIIVIGDTPHDITCGRHIGAKVLAVTTGIHPAEELAGHEPDWLLADLAGWRQWHNSLTVAGGG